MTPIIPEDIVTLATDMFPRIITSIVLLLILIGLSYWQRIEMEKLFLISFTRGLIQIILMATILIVIFELQNLWILYIILLFMCSFAAITAKRRFPYPNIFQIELFSITVGSISVMTFVMIVEIIPTEGTYIIPMGGMVIANVMVMTTIVLERIVADVKKSKGIIEAALALGDTPWNAVRSITRDSFRAGLLPSTNRVAVLGIVTIPGLMSGMIIGGINPIEAAIYQVIIFLMILVGGFIGELIIGFFFIKELFTTEDQLRLALIN
ncbi:MAG: ABC transporter permease [Candidatus Heimdallarchaeota archaeon]|nr:MAG: ABC transporter permease [Candidatus Heimdallarchaeota archaeon]